MRRRGAEGIFHLHSVSAGRLHFLAYSSPVFTGGPVFVQKRQLTETPDLAHLFVQTFKPLQVILFGFRLST